MMIMMMMMVMVMMVLIDDGVDNNLPSVVAATVGVPPGQDLDALLDTSKSRRGLNSEHETHLFVFSSVFISNLYFFRVNQRQVKNYDLFRIIELPENGNFSPPPVVRGSLVPMQGLERSAATSQPF